MTQEKKAEIKIRIAEEEKAEFFRLCKEQAINPSELIRIYINNYIEMRHVHNKRK